MRTGSRTRADASASARRSRPCAEGTAIACHAGQPEAGAVADDDAVRRQYLAQAAAIDQDPVGVGGADAGSPNDVSRSVSAPAQAATPGSTSRAGRPSRAARAGRPRPRRSPTTAGWRARHRRHQVGLAQHVAEAQAGAGQQLGERAHHDARRRPSSIARWPVGRRPRPTRRPSRPVRPAGRSGCGGWSATAARPGAGAARTRAPSTRPPSSAPTSAMASAPPLVSSRRSGSTPMASASAAVGVGRVRIGPQPLPGGGRAPGTGSGASGLSDCERSRTASGSSPSARATARPSPPWQPAGGTRHRASLQTCAPDQREARRPARR